MNKVILDPDLKAKLRGLTEQMEFCDVNGQTMGRYAPEDQYQKLLYQLAESQRPTLSPVEIQRRRQMPGHKSLADIRPTAGTP